MRKVCVAFVALLLLAGCATHASNGTPEGEMSVARARTVLACDAFSRTYQTLAVYRTKGRLSRDQIAQVDQIVPAVKPLCAENAPLLSLDTIALLENYVLRLAVVEQEQKV